MDEERIIYIAKACHEANRVWCQANGDDSQKHWNEAEQWQRDSAIQGVKYRINNPNAKESASHNAWMEHKIKDGWVYGETKDAEKKTHPCIVPYESLPEFQKRKDKLFTSIVDSLFKSEPSKSLKEFEEVVRPVMQYLGENHHPYRSVHITCSSAELVESNKMFYTEDYIPD